MTSAADQIAAESIARVLAPERARGLLEELVRGKVADLHAIVSPHDGLSHSAACRAVVTLLGPEIVSDGRVRKALLASISDSHLLDLYEFLGLSHRAGSTGYTSPREALLDLVVSSGSQHARGICEFLGLPLECAGTRERGSTPTWDEFRPYVPLPPLHDYQRELLAKIQSLMALPGGRRGMVALPTGAGKTRVVMESALSYSKIESGESCLIWVAPHEELCEQAIMSLSQLWASTRHTGDRPIRVQRVWGSRTAEIDWTVDVVVGIVDSVSPRLPLKSSMGRRPIAALVIDEAHLATSMQYERLFMFCAKFEIPIIGISATPASSGSSSLTARFDKMLLEPDCLGRDPVATLTARGILSKIEYRRIFSSVSLQEGSEGTFRSDFSSSVLERIGQDQRRNNSIVEAMLGIAADVPTLCFTSSVAGARIIATALGLYGRSAAAIDAETPPFRRYQTIGEFRAGKLNFLINCQVLAAGFDAPNVGCLVLARPTRSQVLLEQMIGRGLRGPTNGGTAKCELLWIEDDYSGPEELRPLSYRRFSGNWGKYDGAR